MKIKQPYSDNALQSFFELIDFAKDRFTNCVSRNHDTIGILYVSSLIITPTVISNHRKLLNEIAQLVTYSPREFIGVVRTTTPNYFHFQNMKTLQKKSVDFLRNKCYVILYSPRHEFLNHAKFMVYYQVCFSERIVYHGKFYGSTNLTTAGLGNPRRKGNYEEFMSNYGTRFKLGRGDEFYINEVLDLITHKASLYTDPQHLTKYISDHLNTLTPLLRQGREVISDPNSPLERLYEVYINTLIAYFETLALLDEIPGKLLTQDIADKIVSIRPAPNPFEIEMLLLDGEYNNLMIEELGISRSSLQNFAKENIGLIRNAIELIENNYQSKTKEIEKSMDEGETDFLRFLHEYNKTHLKSLEKVNMLIHERKWQASNKFGM